MNIDFSAVDRAVEKVIAKHDALFKFDMLISRIKRAELPYPANFAIAASSSAVIAAQYSAAIREISKPQIIENCEFCCEKEREIN
jgi:hypothetical protein